MSRPVRVGSWSLAALLALALGFGRAALAGAEGAPADPSRLEPELLLEEVLELGPYRIETWATPPETMLRDAMIRIVPPAGEALEVRDAVVRLHAQRAEDLQWYPEAIAVAPGDDLTGDGVPNVLIEGFSMGAHCCFSYELVSLGEGLEVVWQAFTADSSALLVDLRGDGGVQVLLRDMSFAYQFCPFAFTPSPPVVVDLSGGVPVVANRAFPLVYERELRGALEFALAAATTPIGEPWADQHECGVAHLVLLLLYGGWEEQAEQALRVFYRRAGGGDFRDALWAIAEESSWYQAPTAGSR